MACHIGKDYRNWCKDTPLGYRDDNGNHYCDFHAPVGKKIADKEGFDQLVRDRDISFSNSKLLCDMSGTIFEWKVNFTSSSKEKSLHHLYFNNCIFEQDAIFMSAIFAGKTNFRGAIFKKEADFNDVVFEENVSFMDAEFHGKADFFQASFLKAVLFNNTEFNSETRFMNSKFEDSADFNNGVFNYTTDFKEAVFNGNVVFDEALFASGVSFTRTEFKKQAWFTGTNFEGKTLFSGVKVEENLSFKSNNFLAGLNFDESWFEGYLSFNGAKFISNAVVSFSNSHFNMGADFENIYFKDKIIFDNIKIKGGARVRFSYTFFNKAPSFKSSVIDGILHLKPRLKGADETYKEVYKGYPEIPYNELFNNGADFSHMSVNGVVRFEDADIRNVIFEDSDVSRFDFLKCTFEQRPSSWNWLGNLFFGTEKYLTEETRLYQKSKNKQRTSESDYKRIEALNMRLKKKYTQEHDWYDVSNWNFREKEITRKMLWDTNNIWYKLSSIIYLSYCLICGYAERPFRALISLLVILICGSFLNCLAYDCSIVGYPRVLSFTLGQAVFFKDYFNDDSTIFLIVSSFVRLFIYFQATLFIISFRNRFRR